MTIKPATVANHSALDLLKKSAVGMAVVLMLASCTQQEKDEHVFKGEIVEVVEVLKPGMCFDDADEEDTIIDDNQNVSVTSIPIIQCLEPHDNEVYYTYNLPEADNYVETEALLESMFVTCEDTFTDYIGQSYQDSFYEMSFLTPTVDSWQDGDREVVCYAFHPDDKKLKRSLKAIDK